MKCIRQSPRVQPVSEVAEDGRQLVEQADPPLLTFDEVVLQGCTKVVGTFTEQTLLNIKDLLFGANFSLDQVIFK